MFLSIAARGEAPVKSNLDVATDLTAEIASEVAKHFPGPARERGVVVVPGGRDEINGFITNVFIKTLADEGIEVHSPSSAALKEQGDTLSSVKGDPLVLEFQPLLFGIQYLKMYRSHLIGGKRVMRRADVKIFAKLVDPSNDSVLWAGEVERSYSDKFAYRRISQVEQGMFAFTKPTYEPTKWSRIIEPVVVSGIIVGLIYLFYSNQSSE
jgi:hypothetical protein